MKVARTKGEVRSLVREAKGRGGSVGLVPTMGYLHRGHLSLIEGARAENELVVMSLFVNPTQFGEGEDLEAYPRDEERDVRLAAEAGAGVVFAPPVEEVYPAGFATTVAVSGMTDVLCGAPGSRGPGHFSGVTTVVAKLLNVVEPDVAYFGQKDAQQAAVVRRMAADLDFTARIAVLPTVREDDGLAMSSRNAYLEPGERRRAAGLYRALTAAREAARRGEPLGAALAEAREVLAEAGIEPEYLEARDPVTLEEAHDFEGEPVLVAVAARIGRARLIDNLVLGPEGAETSSDTHREEALR